MSQVNKMKPNQIKSFRMQIESRSFKPLEKILKKIENAFPKYDMIKPYLKHKFTEFIYDFKPSAEKLAKIDERTNYGKMIYGLYNFRHERGLFTPYIEVYPTGVKYCVSRKKNRTDAFYILMECNVSEWFLCLNQKERHTFVHREYTKWEWDRIRKENQVEQYIRPNTELRKIIASPIRRN